MRLVFVDASGWVALAHGGDPLIQHCRAELASEVAEARAAYQRSEVRRGTAADLMQELAE